VKYLLGLATAASIAIPSLALAAAPVTENSFTRGKGATAFLEYFDGCKSVVLSVVAADSVHKEGPGAPVDAENSAFVMYSESDSCAGTRSYGSATLPLAKNLNMSGLSLSFTFPVDRFIPTYVGDDFVAIPVDTRTLTASVTLRGVGSTTRTSEIQASHQDGNSIRFSNTAEIRTAEISVAATLGESPVTFTSQTGSLSRNGQGFLLVVHQ
jgi:hypothetical protein